MSHIVNGKISHLKYLPVKKSIDTFMYFQCHLLYLYPSLFLAPYFTH